MKEPKIIQHAGVSLDISRVKCLKLNSFSTLGSTSTLVIEFEARVEYTWNPDTMQHEKHIINDSTQVEFPDYDIARTYTNELEEIWQYHLESLNQIENLS